MKLKGWHKVLIIIIPYFIVVGGFQVIGALLADASLLELTNLNTNQELIIKTFDFLGTFLLIFVMVKWVFKDSFLDLGFHRKGFNYSFIMAAVLVIVGMGSMFALLFISGEVSVSSAHFSFTEFFKSVLFFLLVAMVEEILLRGYVQYYLMQSMNKYIALLIATMGFAAMHLFNPNLTTIGIVNIFVCGLVLGYTYMQTRSLWLPIGIHFWWNFTQVHLGFNVSGQKAYSILKLTNAEPNLLNGGAFGFEGSVLSFVSLIIILMGFYMRTQRRQQLKTHIA